jgi:dipeptidyl aminopeptidase/acylaminoacyl peptidase
VFNAGASHYGVADLKLLAAETHKFESRYLDQLVGKLPGAEEVYKSRSPILFLDSFSAPVAFFQVGCAVLAYEQPVAVPWLVCACVCV